MEGFTPHVDPHPFGASSIVEILRRRARDQPDVGGFTFLRDGRTEAERLTYGELDRRSREIGAALRARGLAGQRVVLLYPPGLEFVAAFFGCLSAGAVAVPAYPPRSEHHLSRLLSIVRDARPRAALIPAATLEIMPRWLARVPELGALAWLATDAAGGATGDTAGSRRDPAGPEDLAFLQYTSGSTAAPKGVMVSHGNLLANQRMIRRAFGQSAESVVVGWLPLYHDMGLIGNVLQTLYVGGRCILMSPAAFLQQPARWLQAISHYRATTSGGPDFAYDLCVRRVTPAQREELDLTSWEVAFDGAEPVRSGTLERFVRAFAPCGFRRSAFFPCYGLAEATLLVSAQDPATPWEPRLISAGALERGRFEEIPAAAGPSRPLLASGRPDPELQVEIVDPESGAPCRPGTVGEIWVAGPGVARGYWEKPEETARTFAARLPGRTAAWLRTGDLGVLAGGELFVTGRIKDLIILRGRNHYPQDLELTAGGSHPALRPGGGAAFQVEGEERERLVIVHEMEPRAAVDVETVAEAVRRRVAEEHELAVDELVLLRAGSLPRTSSGKVQRHACRAGYLEGTLAVLGRSGIPTAQEEESGGDLLTRDALLEIDEAGRPAALLADLRERAGRVMRVASSRLDPGRPLAGMGFDSLAAIELAASVEAGLGVRLPLADLFEEATLERIAASVLSRLEAAAPLREPAAPAAPELGDHPPSDGQRGLWLEERQAPGLYNIAVAARVRGPLAPAALERALRALTGRHPALRTTFPADSEGSPVQRVHAALAPETAVRDAAQWSAESLALEAARPFDLEHGPLLRLRVWEGEERHLLLVVHHLVADFWSLAVMARELGILYAAEISGEPAGLRPPAWSFTDHVHRQRERLAGLAGERLWEFWRQRFPGGVARLDLPADRPRPAVRSFRGGAEPLRLGPGLTGRLAGLARAQQATLSMVLLAAFQALLHRWTGQDEVAVGVPAAGRQQAEVAATVGYFVNPLVIGAGFAEDPTFGALLAAIRASLPAALEHQDLPFPRLAERLRPVRDPSRPPLVETVFVFQQARPGEPAAIAAFALNEPGERLDLGGLALESAAIAEWRAPFDLTLTLAGTAGGLGGSLQYAVDLFDRATARRLLDSLAALLAGIAADPGLPVSRLPVLPEAERTQLLAGGDAAGEGGTGEELPLLPALIGAQARQTPDAVALYHGGEQWTYGEVWRRAGRLARRLRELGVGPEERVGVCLERSPAMLISLLAVLRAGGAYVPLDPAYPGERLAYMLADSGARLLVTRGSLPALPAKAGVSILDLDLDPDHPAAPREGREETAEGEEGEAAGPRPGPDNLAYVIYTSGSTGRPKGVAVEHRNVAALVAWSRATFSQRELSGVLASTSVCFDVSVFELFVPLALGGAILLAEHALALPELPAVERVTLACTVPSAMAELVERGALPPGLRTVNLGGEPVPGALAARLHALGTVERVLNLYGPSEDTTYSTWAEVGGDGAPPGIGRPITGTRAHVLDRRGEPVPVGVIGELYLGGMGVSRGYLGSPDRTAERFVPDPFSRFPGGRLYRTGDLVRRRPDRSLDFLGRLDHQVKIRGFRVELGEVEARLAEHPAVREAVVLPLDGDRLAAFVTAAEPPPGTPGLKAFLAERLPAFMVPSLVTVLPALPRTPNGKVDRRALAALEPAPEAAAHTAPKTPTEEVLASIWAAVLRRERVGRDEDIFELGGHSLAAARVASRVRSAFGVELPLASLFAAPTVAALAHLVEAARGDAAQDPPMERGRWETAPPLSFAQERLWFLDQMDPGNTAYNIAQAVLLEGRLSPAALARSFSEIVRRHETLRATFAAHEGRPVQAIRPAGAVAMPVIDLRALPRELRRDLLPRLAGEEGGRPFDLARGPLLRVLLLRLEEEEHAALLSLHHIAGDGWSMGVLVAELAALYAAFARRERSPLPELPVQYADFAAWQRRRLTGERVERELAVWRRRLGGVAAAIELPADRPRPASPAARGGTWSFNLPAPLAASLGRLGRRQGATPFMTLLAGFQALLFRCGAGTDLPLGTPVAGRNRVETEGLIGLFVNTLVLRGDLAGEPAFAGLLARTREVALEAYAHQDLPFERLVEELQPERELAVTPLFQVLFALQNAPLDLSLPGFLLRPLETETGSVKFDLALSLTETAEGIAGRLAYRADLFDRATAARLAGQLASLLTSAAAGPELPLAELSLLDGASRHQIVVEWGSAPAGPPGLPIHERLAAWAERTPEAPAVAGEGQALSYRELVRRSRGLARHLRRLGVGAEVPVGICLERSPDLLVALLAILAAGGAYVPLDPAHPGERLGRSLADSGAPFVLTREIFAARLRGAPAARPVFLESLGDLAELPGPGAPGPADPRSLAYILYTSGSTGRPKGVAVEHRQLTSYVDAVLERLRPPAGAVFASVSTFAADLGNTMVFPALATGGCLLLVSLEAAQDAAALAGELARRPADYLKIVPSHLAVLLAADADPGRLLPRRGLVLGGEASAWDFASRLRGLAPGLEILNHYGPTETTVGVATWRIDAEAAGHGVSVPLGRPLPGASLRLLGPAFDPLPPQVAGELFVGGASVARGYAGRPDATAERFLPDPFPAEAGARMYRTGDLVRLRPDGSFEFLGRIDHQVKVRGFRIEPAEVEAALAAHPQVREAVAGVIEKRGDRRLVAWVVREGTAPGAGELLAFLATQLPGPMVPGEIRFLERLPLTLNGKLDRAALAAVLPADPAAEEGAGSPQGAVEELLAALWCDLLGRDRVGRRDGFFELGGHSLLATRLIARVRGAFRVDLPLRTLFEAPTLAALARRVEEALRSGGGLPGPPPVEPAQRGAHGELPLSFAQERLWFLERLAPEAAAYNLAYHARVAGPLDVPALAGAFRAVVRRHEVLRSAFRVVGGGPAQIPAASAPPGTALVDLASLPAATREREAARLAAEEARRPFSLDRPPLLRSLLVRLGAAESLLLVTLHHIVSDAWSRGVLLGELAALYGAARRREATPLPPLAVQYGDFAVWQRRWLAGEALEVRLAWWRQRLAGAPALLDLPADRPRPPVQRHRGGRRPARLPRELTASLAALGRREGATLFMVLLAGFAALLQRSSGQEDLVVGTPVAGRIVPETEGLIGFFVNTLALRVDAGGGPCFLALLARAREAALGAYTHQDLPFEKLVSELSPQRSRAHAPVFQVLLALQNVPMPPLALDEAVLTPLESEGGAAKFDWTLSLTETRNGLEGELEFDRDLFDDGTVERALGHLATLLAAAAAEPDLPLAELSWLTAAESRQLAAWNETGPPLGAESCLHELVEAQAARAPGAVAVELAGEEMTYGELNARANALARRLREAGVGPETPVGVCCERSPQAIVSLLAVLKAGGVFLPLDPSYPRKRLAFMVEEARTPVILLGAGLARALPRVPGARVIEVGRDGGEIAGPAAANLGLRMSPDHPAYILYTSGSTGRPKGVVNAHRGIVNRLLWLQEIRPLSPADRVLQKTPFGFDVSVAEIFGPLAAGARLVVARPGGHRDALYLVREMAARGVTVAHFVPSMLQAFLEAPGLERCAGLRRVTASGEALSWDLKERFFARLGGAELHNLYGPTEAAVEVTFHDCRPGGSRPVVPIGRPGVGTRIHVLDAEGRPAPVGVAGRLAIGGVQVARGYLGRPGLTAERFLPDPFPAEPGGRLYDTGDLARRRPDGEIEFLGRGDGQVKVRGFRIEPAEIEAALARHPAVREAAVLARRDTAMEPRLVAYWTPTGPLAPEPAELAAFLARWLPPFMIPADFLRLESLPLLANGKLDRGALPAPAGRQPERDAAHVPPRTAVEAALAGIWADLLAVPRVGVEDDFFALGGHSLLATRVQLRAYEAFGVELPLSGFFERPTVAAQAAAVEEARNAAAPARAAEPALVPGRRGKGGLGQLLENLGGMSDSEAGQLLTDPKAALLPDETLR